MTQAIVVGDIHGCPKQLEEILSQAAKFPDHELVFLGNYIDRGPDSEGVCNLLQSVPAVFLKGNHEDMFLRRAAQNPAGLPALLTQTKLSMKSYEWIRNNLTAIRETDDYIFVHAGLDPLKPLAQQTEHDFVWSTHTKDYSGITKKTVIHGHIAREHVEVMGNRINLNTGCGIGGKLTALVLPEMVYLTSSLSEDRENRWKNLLNNLKTELEELKGFDADPA